VGQSAQYDPPTIEGAWSALISIPAYDRETWINVLASLKAEFGDSAYYIADEWSQTADSYKAADFRAVWKSIKPSQITIKTVFYLAKENGWRPENNQANTKPLPKKKTPPPQKQSNTQAYALRLWMAANRNDKYVKSHPYAVTKDIQSAGGAGRGIASSEKVIGINKDCIIVPIRNIETDKVQGVQCINATGKKQTFGRVSGGALLLGNTLDKSLIWYVCEGWASAYSMVFHHQNGNGVCACSFGKSNLKKVASLIDMVYQPNEVLILTEQD
jgi:putative DNA primase/helicase